MRAPCSSDSSQRPSIGTSASVVRRLTALICALSLICSVHLAHAAGVVGTGTAVSCTDAALNTALAGGGMVTFKCGVAQVMIDISPGAGGTGTKAISADTAIDGGGLITISGGNSVGVFSVNTTGVTFTVQNLTVANGNAGQGGGIYNVGTLTVTNSTFWGNSAPSDYSAGGAIYNHGTLTVTNSTFYGNSSPKAGGGAISGHGTVTVTNSTFFGNSAYYGGAIHAGGPLTVTNSTFSGNGGPDEGGAIDSADSTVPVTLTNTILANSAGANCPAIIDGGHNIDDDGSCGFSTGATHPQLDPAGLKSNGGPTQTIALQASSPAINAGDDTVCAAAPVNNLDQRGFVRPGADATTCSIGAYEYNAQSSSEPTATATALPTPTPQPPCVGDCDGGDAVTVNEIITLVNIALGNTEPSACPHGIPGGAEVNVALIIQAVNHALNGCGEG